MINVRKNTLLAAVVSILIFNNPDVFSQQAVDGSAAVYTRINSVSCYNSNDPDTLFVGDATSFQVHDTVLVFQSFGASAYPPSVGVGKGEVNAMYNTGKYAIFKIGEITNDTTIVLNTTLPGMTPYKSGESGQLIRIPTYDYASVEAGFDFPAWDPVTKTGGVFPVIVRKKLTMNSDMSANGKGFKGGQPAGQYTNDCGASNQGYYVETAQDTAGAKGESVVERSYGYTRGRGHLGSAGGGGNGKFSGGGGGANVGQGGNGGMESSSCPVPGDIGGEFGISLGTFYSNNSVNFYYNRVYMGGAGGTGTQVAASSRLATTGGNGGGIIIILADTLVGNGRMISARGESVTGVATAGAGGGGGGGVIVLSIEQFIGNLNLSVRGGNGGNALAIPDSTGPGGGGGGGMIWFKGTALPVGVNTDTLFGNSGKIDGTIDKYRKSSPGKEGATQSKLVIPIRGFIINSMPNDQTICENESPSLLKAFYPMGGSGAFFYKWQESTDASTWVNASGPNPINLRSYQPPVLIDTMFYRRIVTDQTNPDLADTSFYVTVNVEAGLNNNLVTGSDTVCYNVSPGVLSAPTGMTGGLGTYDYRWIQSGNATPWINATGTNDQTSYSTPNLADTTYYKRIVSSGVCVDTSNKVTITVLADLAGNTISAPQTICNSQTPAPLTGPVPLGGDPADKRYVWEINTSGTWGDAGNTTQNFANPGTLAEGTYNYRRKVFSGSEDACINTSNILLITVLPDITGNSILDDDTLICAGLVSLDIQGNVPAGGDSPDYNYIWQSRPESLTVWTSAQGETVNQPFKPGSLIETTWIRRKILSGPGEVCSNISDSILISILPAIAGNTISSAQTVCEGIKPDNLTGSTPSNGGEGPGTYSWQWQKKASGEVNFSDISINGNQKNYDFSQPLSDTTAYRRIVLSGPTTYYTCRDTSATITISVPPAIGNNQISGPTNRETCVGTSPSVLDASNNPNGGSGDYVYLWEQSTDGSIWSIASGSPGNSDYQPAQLDVPKTFRRIVTSAGVCTDTSSVVAIDTLTRPVLTQLTANKDSVCHLEQNFAIIIGIREGEPAYTAWYSNGLGSGNTEVNNIGQDDQIHVTGFPQQRLSYDFRIDSLVDAKGCRARDENLVLFTAHSELFPDAEPEILLDDSTSVCGSDWQIKANPDLGINYYWTVSNQSIHLDDSLSDQTFARVSGNFDRQESVLKFYAFSPGCQELIGYTPSVDSVKIAFFEQPSAIQLVENSVVIYISDKYLVKYQEPTAGEITWSVLEGNGTFSNISGDSTLISEIPTEASRFRMTVSNGNCYPETADLDIERRNVHIYDGISPLNPDNINDFLVAEGLDTDEVQFTFQLFSTSGLLVREITEKDIDRLGFRRGLPNNGLEIWDGKGKSENNIVPAGVYYYVLEISYKGKKYPPDKNYVVVK